MNLTLTDLLTPQQIDQAHNDLADTMLALDDEENQAITRIRHLYAERRRVARREAILKALQQAPGETQGVPASQGPTQQESEPILRSPVVELPKYEEQVPDYVAETKIYEAGFYGIEASTSPEPLDNVVTIEVPPVQAPAPKQVEAPSLGQCYTAREIATALGVHPSSITNIKRDGLLPEPVPGTGGSPQNPYLYEIPDMAELAARVEERRVNGLRTAGEKLEAYKASRVDRTSLEFLTGLILGAKKDFKLGFFVAYNATENACGIFKFPADLGLPSGWVVVSIVEPKVGGKEWSASNPMTARQEPLASLNERVRDIVMGPRKGGVDTQ